MRNQLSNMDEVVSTLSSFLFGVVVCDLILHISNARLKRKKQPKRKKSAEYGKNGFRVR